MVGWCSKAIEELNPEQPPPTTEIRSPLGAGSWEPMISFTLPIAFSVISTICLFTPGLSGSPCPIIFTGPHHSNLQSLGWRIVGFGRGKIDLEQRRGQNRKSGDRQGCQRISGKGRRKSMAVLSVPGVLSCKVYLLKPCSGSTRR